MTDKTAFGSLAKGITLGHVFKIEESRGNQVEG